MRGRPFRRDLKRSPVEEDGHKEVKGTKWRGGKGKQRHKFTTDELYILNQTFEETPYPDFTTRKELAKQLRCQVYIIDNWFQNKRARLPPRERHRMFAIWKLHEFPVQGRSCLSLQDTQAESPNYTTEHNFSSTEEAVLGRASYSSLETQEIPSQQDGPGDTMVPGIVKEPSCTLEYQGDTRSKLCPAYPFSSYKSALFFHPPTSSVQYFERDGPEKEESQHARPIILHHISTVQGERQQQQEKKAHCHHSLFQGQQANGCRCPLQQPQQLQDYQENLLFQAQYLMHLSCGDLGQQVPSLPSQEQRGFSQTNGEPLCSQLQHTPLQMVVKSRPMPLGQGMRQGAAEESHSEMQHLWDEGSAKVHCWDRDCGHRK
ncbi:cytoplasmic polyadenylated homeobox-like [Equus quagga]|uniref:cytoplasmic polyadenylated homeobox-like n=1 Tax=Equus quagga TaxID=89248 RepID=UPI001EE23835|nr:cytoplasmic polyadenylated homeobox-like [Equus quagga]